LNPLPSLLNQRSAGVLLHITSLPGSGELGTLGRDAYRFVDFLAAAGQRVWQMLPMVPTHSDLSPYQGLSAYAGNSRLIDLSLLVEWGWLAPAMVVADRPAAISAAYQRMSSDRALIAEFEQFRHTEGGWLHDYALFHLLRERFGHTCWNQWPLSLRQREPAVIARMRQKEEESLRRIEFEQFCFFRQWQALRRYANQHNVQLFGDMPIFVSLDSSDVWANQHLFRLTAEGAPDVVAGVPPDYFSATGQRWGNPLYAWPAHVAEGYRWWIDRFRHLFQLYDLVRVDHFRGFAACWVIPASEPTAMNGHWEAVPGDQLFGLLRESFNPLPIVAEDLGIITEDVTALRLKYGLPGMKILQFAFDSGDDNPYLPQHHESLSLVYTGTHDNDTTLGWWQGQSEAQRARVREYLLPSCQAPMPWPLIDLAYRSMANLVIIPLQDLLGLDGSHRMNLPGTVEGNWRWRFDWSMVPDDLAQRIYRMVLTNRRNGGK
jgi:4-alpha-glucanotransferase